MDMGERIRKLRKDMGITQEELGKVIGVQKSAIRKYEAGAVKNLKHSSIKKLADFFSVTPCYILGFANLPQITDEELKFLELYRKLHESDKEDVRILLSTADRLLGINENNNDIETR